MARRILLASCIAGSIVISAPATAQDVVLALNPTTMVGYAGTVAAGEYAKRDYKAAASRPTQPKPQMTLPQIIARTNYQPDPAVRARVYERLVQKVAKINPDDASKLRPALMGGELRAGVAKIMAGYGLSADNLVDTTTVYLAYAWFASRADDGNPTPAQMQGLRRQVALTMADTPGILTASNAVKAEVAEANIYQATVAGQLANQAAADPKLAPQARAAAIRGVQSSYRIDLSQMKLTDQGFR
jgi:hypothetical protein